MGLLCADIAALVLCGSLCRPQPTKVLNSVFPGAIQSYLPSKPGSNRFNFTFSPFPIYFKMQVLYSWILKSNNNKYSPKFIVCKKLLNFHFICDQRFRVVYSSDWLVVFKMIMRFYSTLSFIKCRLIPNRYFVQEQTGIPCFMLR